MSQEFERLAEQVRASSARGSKARESRADESPARESPAGAAAAASPAAVPPAGRRPTTAVTLLRGTSRQLSVTASPNARYASSAASNGFCTSSGKSPYPGLKRPASISRPRSTAERATRSCSASAAASASAEHAASYSSASVAFNAVRRCSSCSRCAPSVTAISAQCVAPSRKRAMSAPGSSRPTPRTKTPGTPVEPAVLSEPATLRPSAEQTESTARAAHASSAARSPFASPLQRSRGNTANTPAGGLPPSQAESAACKRSSSSGSIDCPA